LNIVRERILFINIIETYHAALQNIIFFSKKSPPYILELFNVWLFDSFSSDKA